MTVPNPDQLEMTIRRVSFRFYTYKVWYNNKGVMGMGRKRAVVKKVRHFLLTA